jgi:hypothetical protein
VATVPVRIEYNREPASNVKASGFPCAIGPFNPQTADGILDDGQTLTSPQVLFSKGKKAYAAFDRTDGKFCVGMGSNPGVGTPLWCSPPAARDNMRAIEAADVAGQFRITMQGDNNLCGGPVSGKNSFCVGKPEPVAGPHCGPACRFYARLNDDGSFCTYNSTHTVTSGDVKTWCAPGTTTTANVNSTSGDEAGRNLSAFAVDLEGRSKSGATGCSFAHWQAQGFDAGSAIVDPLFVDAGGRDFRLKPGSPALAMGMHSLDTSGVGPRGEWKDF